MCFEENNTKSALIIGGAYVACGIILSIAIIVAASMIATAFENVKFPDFPNVTAPPYPPPKE